MYADLVHSYAKKAQRNRAICNLRYHWYGLVYMTDNYRYINKWHKLSQQLISDTQVYRVVLKKIL